MTKNMISKKSITVIGTAIVDCMVKGFDPVPVSASGYRAGSAGLFPGGEALNQSIILKRLGMEPHIVCGLGQDSASRLLTDSLAKEGVDLRYAVRNESFETPVSVIFVDEKGERQSITNKAHAVNFRPDRNREWVEACGGLSIASLFRAPFSDPKVVLSVVKAAKETGAPVYADTKLPNFYKLTLSDLSESLPFVDYIFPNEKEAQYYSGVTFETERDVEKAADVFLSCGIGNVIIKLGEKGCFFKNRNEKYRIPAIKVETVDATGAGDSFAAGFITAMAEGKGNEEALCFASCLGAICATKTGAVSALADRNQADGLYGKLMTGGLS